MATVIGSVDKIKGEVTAMSLEGVIRNLQGGDVILLDEVITTAKDSGIEIKFNDGSEMALGGDSQVLIDQGMFPEGIPIPSDVDAIQQALLDGDDPTQDEEATAAGENVGEENSGFSSVYVSYNSEESIPTNGFDTTTPVNGSQTPFETEALIQDPTEVDNAGQQSSVSPILTTSVAELISSSETTIIANRTKAGDAGFSSSYGFYVKTLDSDGNVISNEPTKGFILENDVMNRDGDSSGVRAGDINPTNLTANGGPLLENGTLVDAYGNAYSSEQVGFFIIPNGFNMNPGLIDGTEVNFIQLSDGSWQAVANGEPLKGDQRIQTVTEDQGNSTPTVVGVNPPNIYFDDPSLNLKLGNPNGVHTKDNPNADGNQNWEDVFGDVYGGGDYNDLNMELTVTEVKVSGEKLDSVDFGGDTEQSINFTLDSVSPYTLTSNNNDITFEARDTDGDGNNDQIVGYSSDGQDVLTISGILDGDYSVDVIRGIDDIQLNANTDIDLGLTVTATDTDGDTGTVSLSLNIDVISHPIQYNDVTT